MKPVVITAKFTSHEGSLKQYIKEVNKYPLLSDIQLLDTCDIIKNGSEKEKIKATELLIQSNLRFVISVAKQYMKNDVQFADLINEGNVGLINAAKKYDATMNIKFLSYAVWWIRKHILLFINEDRMIRIPQNRVINQQRIKKFNEEYEQQNGFESSVNEMLKLENVSNDDVELYLTQLNLKPISLSTPIEATEGDSDISDLVTDDYVDILDSSIEQEHTNHVINQLLKTLKPRNREIISDLFGIGIEAPLTNTEVGEKHNLTRERVRQIKEEILLMLRKKSEFLV